MNRAQIQIIKEALEFDQSGLEFDQLLNEWEINFINDLAEKEDDYELSEARNHIVNKIGNKVAAW